MWVSILQVNCVNSLFCQIFKQLINQPKADYYCTIAMSSYTVNFDSILNSLGSSDRDNGIWTTVQLPKHSIKASTFFLTFLGLTVPVNGTSLLYMCYNDAMGTSFGATTPCYLYAQALLTLHHMHLPDVVAVPELQKSTTNTIYYTGLRFNNIL